MSIIGGVIAGILGFTSLTGFIFYFLVMAITSVGLIAKAGFSIHSYFGSWNQIVLDGFLSGLLVCSVFNSSFSSLSIFFGIFNPCLKCLYIPITFVFFVCFFCLHLYLEEIKTSKVLLIECSLVAKKIYR